MHIWQSCEQQHAQLKNLPRLLFATSMMQHKSGPLCTASQAMYLPADPAGNECGTIGRSKNLNLTKIEGYIYIYICICIYIYIYIEQTYYIHWTFVCTVM